MLHLKLTKKGRLKGCEGKLQNITSSQGSNTSSFVSLVQECSNIQTQLLVSYVCLVNYRAIVDSISQAPGFPPYDLGNDKGRDTPKVN
jgi:hypothetical protein